MIFHTTFWYLRSERELHLDKLARLLHNTAAGLITRVVNGGHEFDGTHFFPYQLLIMRTLCTRLLEECAWVIGTSILGKFYVTDLPNFQIIGLVYEQFYLMSFECVANDTSQIPRIYESRIINIK